MRVGSGSHSGLRYLSPLVAVRVAVFIVVVILVRVGGAEKTVVGVHPLYMFIEAGFPSEAFDRPLTIFVYVEGFDVVTNAMCLTLMTPETRNITINTLATLLLTRHPRLLPVDVPPLYMVLEVEFPSEAADRPLTIFVHAEEFDGVTNAVFLTLAVGGGILALAVLACRWRIYGGRGRRLENIAGWRN